MVHDKLREPLIPIDETKRKESLTAISRAAAQHSRRRRVSLSELFLNQLGYISKEYWIAQTVFLLAAMALFLGFRPLSQIQEIHLPAASALSSGLGLAVVLELSRSRSYHMGELEQSCCFNLGQIWILKLLLTAGIDLCILTLVLAAVYRKTSYGLTALCLYLMVPFILSNGCYFLLLCCQRTLSRKLFPAAAAFLLLLGILFPLAFPKAYLAVYLPVWALVLAGGLFLTGLEFYLLCHMLSTGGKKLCWN